MTDPLEHIRRLAKENGPRPACSQAEWQAAEYIAGRLTAMGYVVRQEKFRSVRSFSHVYGLIYAAALFGFLASAYLKPDLGFLVGGIALVAFMGENTTALRLASTLIPKGRSQNVIGRLVPTDLPRRRLVIAAHYDTTRSGLMFHPSLVKSFRLQFLVTFVCLLVLPALALASALAHDHVYFLSSIPFAAVLLCALALLIHRELFFKHVPGANDNASGVAVALSLAEALAQDAPGDTEVLVVATGCEEVGMVGMEAFLKAHRDELSRAWIVNVDNVGAGNVHYVTSEGMLIRHRGGKELVAMAEKVAALPGLNVTPTQFHVASTDAEPALLRGLDAMTVIALRGGVPVNYHWATDTFEGIDQDSVDTAYRFIEALVRRLIA
ncbi:MAG: M28 family metallopeptidase [Candidatus Dormibacteria bacterium]